MAKVRDKSVSYDRIGTEKRIGTPVPILRAGIGTRISEAAARIGSRKAASEVMECSDAALQRYIKEINMPPFDVAARLCAAAGVSMEWLAAGIAPESIAQSQSHDLRNEQFRLAVKMIDHALATASPPRELASEKRAECYVILAEIIAESSDLPSAKIVKVVIQSVN